MNYSNPSIEDIIAKRLSYKEVIKNLWPEVTREKYFSLTRGS